MNLEDVRAHVQLARSLAPGLYTTGGAHRATEPALIHPPAWMCHPCQDAWGRWGGAEIPAHQLDGAGEGRRRQVIAQRREDIAVACHRLGHERDRAPTPPAPAVEVEEAPESLVGARVKALLDAYEAFLPRDDRPMGERLADAAKTMRRTEYERQRAQLVLPDEVEEGAA